MPLLVLSRSCLALACCAGVAVTAHADPALPLAGRWTITLELKGSPRGNSAQTRVACLRADTLARPETAFRNAAIAETEGIPRCELSDISRGSGSASWSGTCAVPGRSETATASGRASWGISSYEGSQTLRVKLPFGTVEIRESLRAERGGTCD
jgi:hypothetical protein